MNNAHAALACAGMGIIAATVYVTSGDRVLVVVSAVMFAVAAWQLRLARK